MSFSVMVSDLRPLSIDDLPDEFEKQDSLLNKELKNALYDKPIVSDGAFYRLWHTPAAELNLFFLSEIYNSGFSSSEPGEIDELRQEIVKIQLYWAEGISLKMRDMIFSRGLSIFCELFRLHLNIGPI